ncbi:hypothetical protein MNBD_GAMMA21-1694 [hydrothermal vent metagenome]|uniref:DUF302 domain-containing protein n=1 Tax=hydrothermal vent metagenome TaxID=652676 RepID=A0A3B1ACC7_9ZZZZ
MKWLWNIFAIVGVAAIGAMIWGSIQLYPSYRAFQEFDDKALDTYIDMGKKLLASGNAAEATIWRREVNSDLSVEDVEDVMKSVANELNIKNVGELPLSKQVEAMTGKKQRFLKIYMYCNPLTAAKMVDYSDSFSAYLPCRLSLVEDKQGKFWIYSLNMDMMIHGGKPLPPELKPDAERVREVILAIMERSASGEF